MTHSTDSKEIAEFLQQAGFSPDCDHEVRMIGTDEEMVNLIIGVIASGEKSITYSLPWVAERTGKTRPEPDRIIVVLDAKGSPELALRITKVEDKTFGGLRDADLAREGIPMRTLAAWKPLHTMVWNGVLAPFELEVTEDMPVWAEYFDLAYNRAA